MFAPGADVAHHAAFSGVSACPSAAGLVFDFGAGTSAACVVFHVGVRSAAYGIVSPAIAAFACVVA